MTRLLSFFVALLLGNTMQAAPQVDGVVNAASFAGSLAPGSLAALFREQSRGHRAPETCFDASRNAFPTSVAGVSVSVNGVPAPLIYTSPGQINFQVSVGDAAGRPPCR